MAQIANRYASQDLFIAQSHRDSLGDFVSRADRDGKPFSRQVDAWWLAIGLGVREGIRTPLPAETVKFNDGGILGSDPWRITHLELLAIAEAGESVLDQPAQVIRIASEYANTGFPWLFDVMLGQSLPTLVLMNRLSEMLEDLRPDRPAAARGR